MATMADEALNHDDGFVTSGGLRLHYQVWGPPSAAGTLILVHGLGSSCHIWDLTAPLLDANREAWKVPLGIERYIGRRTS